jgi:hypothetical protein
MPLISDTVGVSSIHGGEDVKVCIQLMSGILAPVAIAYDPLPHVVAYP